MSFFKKIDFITKPTARRLHFGDDSSHKSSCGGLFTLLCIVGFIGVAVFNAANIYHRNGAYKDRQIEPFDTAKIHKMYLF